MLGIIVFSFYIVIPYYLLFRYRSFSINLLKNSVCFIFSFILSGFILYSSVLDFDFSMEVLTTKNYFGFGTRSFYKKRGLHHKRDQRRNGPFRL